MKGKNWKLWGLLCLLALLFGVSHDELKAQAMDEHRIYTITPEENFIFNEETGMITAYQEGGVYVEGTLEQGQEQEPQPTTQPEATEVVIPATIHGVEVKGLSGAFEGNTVLQKLVIPDTLKEFGDKSFYGCKSLSSISVYKTDTAYTEEEVTEKQLQDYSLRFVSRSANREGEGELNTVEEATGDMALYYEVVDKGGNCVIIPPSLESIGEAVFYSCAFAGFDVMEGSSSFCDSGESGEGVGACLMSLDQTKLYRMAPGFRAIDPGQQYSIPAGVEEVLPYAGQGLGWQYVQVSTTVKVIDAHAFDGSNLLGVLFAETSQVETIGDWAFAHNDNMDIILPPSVKTIGKYSFAYIANRTPDLSKTQITVIPEYAFAGCPNLHTITMPATLLVIEPYAFAGNANLNEVVFTGDTLESIGTGAFQNCQNMHKIDIPEGVTTIEPGTFEGCSNLNTVILPEGLKEIKDNAFSNCPNIHEMVIPSTVTSIADNSFSGSNTQDIDTSKNAYARQKISGKAALPKVGDTVIKGKLVYKYTKSTTSGGTVTVWKVKSKSVGKISIPASISVGGRSYSVTAIAAKAFQKCKKLKSVTIGTNVKTIGTNAFGNCKKLKKITIKTTKLTKSSVKANAFKGIYKKASVKVPKKKLKAYKKFLWKKGLGKKAKIKK